MFRFLPLLGLLALAAPETLAEDAAAAGVSVTDVDAAGAAKLLAAPKQEGDLVILDIRTPGEFKGGRIAGSTNIDFYSDEFRDKVAKLDRSKTYLVYCASGGRSRESLGMLRKLGFRTVYHLEDGIRGWRKAGMPVAGARTSG